MALAEKELKTENLDHHGIVAGVVRELDLVGRINQRIGSRDPRRVIQPGVAVMAMIINGLGFTNRRLYLSPQFFESKPIDRLFEGEVRAEQLDDHALGKALDEIAAYGPTRFFGEIALDIALEKSLLGDTAHLDSTRFSLTGQYDTDEVDTIEVSRGFSKDHRPDLKQVMLSMVCSGPGHIPVWMEPQNGNSSDKKSFQETLQAMTAYQDELRVNKRLIWVADSAFYTIEQLQKVSNLVTWVSRVPETISACRDVVEQPNQAFNWVESGEGYSYCELSSDYAGIAQRWLLVSSEKAYARESKTFEKKLTREAEKAKKACWHQSCQVFHCREDAEKSLLK